MTEQLGLGLDVPAFPCAGCNGARSALCADCEAAAREAATRYCCEDPALQESMCDGSCEDAAEPVRVPRAMEEYLAGFASYYAYGPKPTAAQSRQAAMIGRELGERLAAFKQSGAA